MLHTEIQYLAHVRRAEIASVRRFVEIVNRKNPQPSFFVDEAWIRIDFREAFSYFEMIQNRLDEKHIRITHNPQITSEKTRAQTDNAKISASVTNER